MPVNLPAIAAQSDLGIYGKMPVVRGQVLKNVSVSEDTLTAVATVPTFSVQSAPVSQALVGFRSFEASSQRNTA